MNITKIEIIKSLLDDPKVESVEVKYREGSNEAVFTLKVFSSKSLIFKSLRHPMTAIQAFTPIYRPTPDIGAGDLVWVEGKGKMFLRSLSGEGFTVSADHKSSTRMFFENKTRISLLEKAESNDE